MLDAVFYTLAVLNHRDSVGRGLSLGSKIAIAVGALVLVALVILLVTRVVARLGSRRPERDSHAPGDVGR